ncbi:MAG: glycerol-3-phosphate dehydrogenase/oxidase [Verrucomicrobium sp.]|nr:glycerol-3-phosphate dehydrogenase/oxidase [Verrucomicrobium sp.]
MSDPRPDLFRRLEDPSPWDVLIIGGGATGLGSAVEAASRGYRTLLVEQVDFAKATSSRATKLAHGGVRYLQQGNIALVYSALRERGLMIRNAPHLVRPLSFIIPAYRWWEKAFYGFGLEIYELMAAAGRLSLGHSHVLSRAETIRRLPTVKQKDLRGGVSYHDGQFDDTRLAVALLRTFEDQGGTALNYTTATGFVKSGGKISGVRLRDEETGREYEVKARAVLNATGIFTDQVRRLDDAGVSEMLSVSQGTHIVLDRSFLPSRDALMIPKTEDGRVLFGVPWHGRVVVGTTDLGVPKPVLEPRAQEGEVEFLLHHASKYLDRPVGRGDVLSIFSGLRPLVKAGEGQSTKQLSRDHTIVTSGAGLVTITGGKWTTYRHMGEDAVNHLEEAAGFAARKSVTAGLHLHGWMEPAPGAAPDIEHVYGSDAPAIAALAHTEPGLEGLLHARLPYRRAEVVWAARHEHARTVEDILARRTRALLLDARASGEAAPEVARLLAAELGRDEAWQKNQVEAYQKLVQGYVLH